MTAHGVDPVRWWVFDDACSTLTTPAPNPKWIGWEAHYTADCERGKRTVRNRRLMPSPASDALDSMQGGTAIAAWCERLGYPVLPDPTGHGGGLHVTSPGGQLGIHLDYDRHPLLPSWRRALNLIAFIHPEWKSEWGGAFVLCDPMGQIVHRIEPRPGRLIAFETNDLSYHGVEPITGPAERVSVAAYYLSPATAASTRRRAMFLPAR